MRSQSTIPHDNGCKTAVLTSLGQQKRLSQSYRSKYFTNLSTRYVWSGTPFAGDSDLAWVFDTEHGAATTEFNDNDYYNSVRFVRTGKSIDAPTQVIASAGNAQASVSFTAPSTTGGSAITAYTVTSIPGNITAAGTASPITVSGLTNNISYTFTVTATNATGTSAASVASNPNNS